ncbi:Hypothetical predicted protein [Marmota monax]|uniref:Uncharacterized protein n=1 Tax=Marmota monax TaxID=9995 RepID=A0A5E4C3M3_MARMO|nr:Hypothetical predicted protein [Marmota monax]
MQLLDCEVFSSKSQVACKRRSSEGRVSIRHGPQPRTQPWVPGTSAVCCGHSSRGSAHSRKHTVDPSRTVRCRRGQKRRPTASTRHLRSPRFKVDRRWLFRTHFLTSGYLHGAAVKRGKQGHQGKRGHCGRALRDREMAQGPNATGDTPRPWLL